MPDWLLKLLGGCNPVLTLAWILGSLVSTKETVDAGKAQKEAADELAGIIEKYGEEEAAVLEAFGEEQVSYLKEQAGVNYEFSNRSLELSDQQVGLFELGVQRDIDNEKRAAGDRERGRQKRILDALSSQAALRSGQGIQAYDGSSLNMMRSDYKDFQREQIIDRGDTAERTRDMRFFGQERSRLMRANNSLMSDVAASELDSAIKAADLQMKGIHIQSDSIKRSTELEAAGTRAQGSYAQRAANLQALNTLISAGYRYSRIGP